MRSLVQRLPWDALLRAYNAVARRPYLPLARFAMRALRTEIARRDTEFPPSAREGEGR